jgi:hypothetical protein
VKIFKIIIKFLLGLCVLILALLILQFVVNSKYAFPEPHAFNGGYIYNPYRNIDSTKWRRANFHAHARKFFEQSDKARRSIPYIDSLYRSFGYDIISISDYQAINRYESKNNWYVPVYEHGYQYYKNHHLVLNAKKVSWLDFPFRQTLSNKQNVINNLKKDPSSLITIVHPIYRKALSSNDLKYLGNYNCLEIANHDRLFTAFYDTVLSNGHPVFIMADDDCHDLTNIKEVNNSFNVINTDLVKDSILNALSYGRSFGVKLNASTFKTNEDKREAFLNLPKINKITFQNDTLAVSLSHSVRTIKFIGQHGAEIMRITNHSEGSCFFSKQDTYIRTEIECNDGTLYFLNPLFRYDGTRFTDYVPTFNAFKTWAWRLAFFCLLLIIFIIWYRNKCITVKK